MAFPWEVLVLLAELPVGAFDGATVATGAALVAAGAADPEGDGAASEATDAPPRLAR